MIISTSMGSFLSDFVRKVKKVSSLKSNPLQLIVGNAKNYQMSVLFSVSILLLMIYTPLEDEVVI